METSEDMVLQKGFDLVTAGKVQDPTRVIKGSKSIIGRSEDCLLLVEFVEYIGYKQTGEVSNIELRYQIRELADVGSEGLESILFRQDRRNALSSN